MTKTAEKIIASRLAYLANTTDIVNFDQMSSRKQISAIDAIMSSILFLIYIRDIFSEINSMQIRSSSYVDDIKLVASSETIKENYLILENAAEKLLQLQNQNNI